MERRRERIEGIESIEGDEIDGTRFSKEGGQLPLGQAYLTGQSWLGEKCL